MTLGHPGGNLACKNDCSLDTSGCSWVVPLGGTGHDHGVAIAADGIGNTVTSGIYHGTITVGSNTLTAKGSRDILVTKLAPSGTVLWATSVGGAGEDTPSALVLDAAGNTTLVGDFSGTATFGSFIRTAKGGKDLFVARLDSTGKVTWVTTAGGTGNDNATGVGVDSQGNVTFVASTTTVATFGTTTVPNKGSYDIVVAKLTGSGSFTWVKAFGGTGDDRGFTLAVDSASNTFITGWYTASLTFGSTTLTSVGGEDVYLTKLDSSGKVLWAKSASGTQQERAYGLLPDGSGGCFLGGHFTGTTTFDSTSVTSKGSSDAYIAKYSAAGKVSWVKTFGGSGTDSAGSMARDSAGNIYFNGDFYGTATFGNFSKVSHGYADMFLVKLDSLGVPKWVVSAGGSKYDSSNKVVVDSKGNAYVTGVFCGPVAFGKKTVNSTVCHDIYIWKLPPGGI